MKHINILSIAFLFFLFMNSCRNTKPAASDGTISHARWYEKDSANQIITKPAPQWAEMLRQKNGWLGADGMYSVSVNGVETPGKSSETTTLFWFSDCIVGNIVNDTLQRNWQFLHNSVAYMDGDKTDAEPHSFLL